MRTPFEAWVCSVCGKPHVSDEFPMYCPSCGSAEEGLDVDLPAGMIGVVNIPRGVMYVADEQTEGIQS